jgi:glycosyltransferase involved in cell wall biosynthesis
VVSEAAPRRRRAVVLVGGPAAPYSRAIRIARALAAEGFDVEIAAIAAPGLPEREPVAAARPGSVGEPAPDASVVGEIEIKRYQPSGPWAVLGASEAATAARGVAAGDTQPGTRARGQRTRILLRTLAAPLLAVRRWLFWPHAVRGWWATLAKELPPADLYHACGALAIAPAIAARTRNPRGPSGAMARVIHDAVDHAGAGNEAQAMPAAFRRLIARREAGWARAADAIVTVNDALVTSLSEAWRPAVPILAVPNNPEPPDPAIVEAPPSFLRDAAGLPAGTRIVLYQGRLGPGLGLAEAAEAVLLVPSAALVLLGFGRGLGESLARDRDPRFAGRHVTLPPIPPDELLAWTAGADVALIAAPPMSPNQRLSSANKFWEAIAVGTPNIVVRGLDTMAGILTEYDLGAVAASAAPADIAAAIRTVLERVDREGGAWRRRIAAVGRERFSWPTVATAYRSLVRSLVPSVGPANDGGSTSQST